MVGRLKTSLILLAAIFGVFWVSACATTPPPATTATSVKGTRPSDSVVPVHAPTALDSAAAIYAGGKIPPQPGADANAAKTIDDNGMTTLSRNRYTRYVQMQYRLDLYRNNGYAKKVASAMKPHEDKLRACYTDRLEANPELNGDMRFDFRLSKDSKFIRKIKRAGGKLQDKMVEDCLIAQLRKMPINPQDPPRSMRGRLDYVFNVIEKQTAKQASSH